MPATEHSKLGASSAHQWMNCPASVRLCEGVADEATTYANEGSAAHALAEKCLETRTNAHDHLGIELTHGGEVFIVDVEMADAVQEYVNIIREDLSEVLGISDSIDPNELYQQWTQSSGIEFGVEHRFHLDWLDPILFGTNDCYIGDALGVLRVYDYKHGAGVPVSAKNNPQLMYYALGCLGKDNLKMYHTVEIIVVQPRCWDDSVVPRWTISVEDLYAWAYERLLPAAKAAQAPDAKYVVGEKQCRWCRARGECQALAEQNMDLIRATFDDVSSSPTVVPPTAERLTSDELGQINKMLPLFEQWTRSIRAEIAKRLERGEDSQVLGAKLVKKRSLRAWEDTGKAQVELMDAIGNDVLDVKLKSPAQVEKIIKQALRGRKNTEQRNEMLDWLSQFIVTPDTGYTVVSLDNPREAVEANVAFDTYKR